MLILLIVPTVVFAIDIFLKRLADKMIAPGEYIEVAKNKFFLTNIKNKGAAYGLFAKNRKLLMVSTIASLAALVAVFKDVFKKGAPAWEQFSFSLILGGALGNLYDRLKHKEVTDFLYIKYKKAPIFNFADIAILLGSVIAIIKSFTKDV